MQSTSSSTLDPKDAANLDSLDVLPMRLAPNVVYLFHRFKWITFPQSWLQFLASTSSDMDEPVKYICGVGLRCSSLASGKQCGRQPRRSSRRLITLIFAGRNRIIVIRRELPRTKSAGWARRATVSHQLPSFRESDGATTSHFAPRAVSCQ